MPQRRSNRSKKVNRQQKLRERAQGRSGAARTLVAELAKQDVLALVDELQVRLKELEIQTEDLRSSQRDLAESRDRYSFLYDFAPVGYMTVDARGKILEANLAAASMLGVERQWLVNGSLSNFVARKAQDIWYLHRRATFSSETQQSCELDMRGANGKPLRVFLESIATGRKPNRRCHVALIDTTERKQIELALQRLTQLPEKNPGLVLQISKDGDLAYANPPARVWLANTWNWTAGTALPDPLSALVADARRHEIIVNAECIGPTGRTFAFFAIRPPGESFVNAYGFDITERKRAEEALRESEELYRATFENAAVGIAHVAPDGRLLGINDKLCQIVGYSREQLLTKTFQELTHPDDVDANLTLLKRTLAGEIQTYNMEKRYIRSDGSSVWTNLTASLIREPRTKAPLYFVSVVENITKRKRAEEQLRQLTEQLEQRVLARTKELKSVQEQLRAHTSRLHALQEETRAQLASELHDEFGAALTALKVDLHWIMKHLPKKINGLAEKTKTMSNLIDDTVESVRRMAAMLRPRLLDDFGLVAAIEWQCEEFERRNGIRCVTISPEELTLDHAISTALFRIFQEALTNVARHANATEVSVHLQLNSGKVLLTVEDNGIGITPEAISTDKSFGLFGMQERARALDGHVRVKRGTVHGTMVTVEIPLNNPV